MPISGVYLVTAGNQQNATYTAGHQAKVGVFVDGTAVVTGTVVSYGSAAQQNPSVSGMVRCLAGSLITIKSYNEGSATSFASTGASNNHFEIVRVGNY